MEIQYKEKKIKLLALIISIVLITTTFSSSVNVSKNNYVKAIVLLEPNAKIDNLEIEYLDYLEALNGFIARMRYSTYMKLKQLKLVREIDIVSEMAPASPCYETLDWGVDDIDAEKVWGGYQGAKSITSGNPTGYGVKVGIIDQGINWFHDELMPNVKEVHYWGSAIFDLTGHGTACAGIITAVDNNKGTIGVAPEAFLYSFQVTLFDPISVTLAINKAIERNVNVISMSFGWVIPFPTVQAALNIAYLARIVLVAASGNGGARWVLFPASEGSVIAVGMADMYHNLAPDSNYGPQQELIAPGVEITTTHWLYPDASINALFSGTSAAGPHVAGICALMLSAEPGLSPETIRHILTTTAEDIYTPGWDEYSGYGFVDAEAAVNEAYVRVPEVEITSPSGTVFGTVNIRANANDENGILKVSCKIDNGPWMHDYDPPYEWSWNTLDYVNGQHTILCRAWDNEGTLKNYKDAIKTISVLNGGGGCPILSVFNGEEYIEEGLLDIHSPKGIDVITTHTLVTIPEVVNDCYLLRLTEHQKTISHIDQVKLFGRMNNGKLIPLGLNSATHSGLGQVRWMLRFSDDNRVDVLGADHNEGVSEFIDLEFVAPKHRSFEEFIFVIEGHNVIIK